jgi:single-stranded-DNA-specific exonuclease
MTFELAQRLKHQVWGQGFPEPRFAARFAVESQRVVGDKHLKLALTLDGRRFSAIRFGCADLLPSTVHAVYRLDVNEYQGEATLQLIVEHVEG